MSTLAENSSAQVCALAALILEDDNIEITAEKIEAIAKATGIEHFESAYARVFAKAYGKIKISDMLSNFGSAPAAGAVAAAPAAAAGKEEKKKEEKKPEPEEEDVAMGLDLFG